MIAPVRGTPRLLVLDGETRIALAVVRSLGRAGAELLVASGQPDSLAQVSRFTDRALLSPSPKNAPREWIEWLFDTIENEKPDLLLPLTDRSVTLTLGVEKEIRAHTRLPHVSNEIFQEVADKGRLVQQARILGVPAPRTLRIPPVEDRPADLAENIRQFPYPAVLKPEISEVLHESRFVKVSVEYPESADDVLRLIDPSGNANYRDVPLLLQERIRGVGVGVFAVCRNGEPLALFAHRRRLEKPPSGGVSVLCESIPLSQAPVDEALRLLRHYKWEGAAMVEFKERPDGTPYLMEINPRFWGSLQLAIDAGVDFPAILYRSIIGETDTVANPPTYESGRRMRWLLGTVDHLIIRMKREPLRALGDIIFRNALLILARPTKTSLQVYRSDDPAPFSHELRDWIHDTFRRVGARRRSTRL